MLKYFPPQIIPFTAASRVKLQNIFVKQANYGNSRFILLMLVTVIFPLLTLFNRLFLYHIQLHFTHLCIYLAYVIILSFSLYY